MKYSILIFILSIIGITNLNSQGYPWNNPLRMAWSQDGIQFEQSSIFQDSAGVPSVVKWKGDTLISVFQWFRAPVNSISWDRVAVRFSYNNGNSWTEPVPIVVNGLPQNYQRPFDPTLTVFGNDSLRIYFSSSNGMPKMGADSIIDTYSAKSTDGINFMFEPNPRVNEASNRLIDPAVIYFNSSWHYLSPAGSPQQGAYHYVSPDGLNFKSVPRILSDNQHNWTGNYMVENSTQLRFYGSSPTYIWYNSSKNGGVWDGYVNTNLKGGDPSVVKVSENRYLMIYVGQPYNTDVIERKDIGNLFSIPMLVNSEILINDEFDFTDFEYRIYSNSGELMAKEILNSNIINVEHLVTGVYFIEFQSTRYPQKSYILKFMKN